MYYTVTVSKDLVCDEMGLSAWESENYDYIFGELQIRDLIPACLMLTKTFSTGGDFLIFGVIYAKNYN